MSGSEDSDRILADSEVAKLVLADLAPHRGVCARLAMGIIAVDGSDKETIRTLGLLALCLLPRDGEQEAQQ